LVVVRRFRYDKLLVSVPRCAGCAQVHAKTKKRMRAAIITGAAAGFVLGIPTAGGAGITAAIGGLIGYWLAKSRAKKLYDRQQIKALKRASFESYPPMSALFTEGWRLEKPGGSIFSKTLFT
ncbi:MAG TPA: hypothetical protein VHC47_13910, partial [Mucilaginibacter sp.]|nr:hypothetical protein [Mucilaginibacter sp.]